MSNPTASILLGNLPDETCGALSYWVRMEQESQEPDAVTTAHIAELTDSIFKVEPCIDPTAFGGGDDREVSVDGNNDPTVFEQAQSVYDRAREILALPMCGSATDQLNMNLETGDYDAKLLVFRSSVCQDYEIVLTRGVVGMTTRVREDITITVQVSGKSVTLDLPIARACDIYDTYDYKWEPSAAVKCISGSTVIFDEYVDILTLTYTTEHDEVAITVTGMGGGVVGQCTAFCLYMGLSVDLKVEPPETDDEDKFTCTTVNFAGISDPNDPDDGTPEGALPPWDGEGPKCYQTTEHIQKCVCTGKKHDSYDTEHEVNCPDSESDGAHGVGDTLKSISYVNCGIIDEYGTPEFYEKACCHPGSPPVRCKTMYGPWSGGAGDSSKLDKYRDKPRTSLIPVTPDGGCGETITTQKVTGNCCEDIDPLEIVSVQPDEMVLGGSVRIDIEGDLGPVLWEVNGGYTLAWDSTGTPSFNIVTMDSEGACYDAVVRIKGQCDIQTVRIPLDKASIPPLEITNQEPIVMAPNAYLWISASGGVLEYEWDSGELTLVEAEGNSALFLAPSDFCGMATVTVTDECGDNDSLSIKSTQGHWEQITSGGVECDLEGDYPPPEPIQTAYGLISYNGGYKCDLWYNIAGWYSTCAYPEGAEHQCGHDNVVIPDWNYVCDLCSTPGFGYNYMIDCNTGCCIHDASNPEDPPGTNKAYVVASQGVLNEYRWECP